MDLENRVRRLERTNRLLMLALALVVGGALAWTSSEADTLRGERLEIVDAEGRVRIALEAPATGPKLEVFDESDVVRALLTDDEVGTRLYVNDDAGDTRVGVAQFAHGGGGFALHGPAGKGAAILYLKGDGSLTMLDDDGEVTARFPGG